MKKIRALRKMREEKVNESKRRCQVGPSPKHFKQDQRGVVPGINNQPLTASPDTHDGPSREHLHGSVGLFLVGTEKTIQLTTFIA